MQEALEELGEGEEGEGLPPRHETARRLEILQKLDASRLSPGVQCIGRHGDANTMHWRWVLGGGRPCVVVRHSHRRGACAGDMVRLSHAARKSKRGSTVQLQEPSVYGSMIRVRGGVV